MLTRQLLALSLVLSAACGAASDEQSVASPVAAPSGNEPSAMTGASGAAVSVAAAPAAAAPSGSAPAAATVPMTAPAAASAASSNNALPAAPASAKPPNGPSGISVDPESGEVVFRTDPVALKAFAESYTCFAVTVPEDMVIDGFKKSGQLFVHHEQFVKALLPEPEGVSICNEQFKITWLPIFLAGNGPSELQFDEGVGHVITAGTQLVLQMHLFNATDKDVKEAVEIRMHKSTSPNPTPVTPWAIGSSEIKIPPREPGRAQKVCTQTGHVEVLAVFPHMHQLGNKMTIEVGKSMDAMQPLYARDPFSFDDQRMEKMKLVLEENDILRVTCDFKTNMGDTPVEFGESSNDEMCFFVGFALGEAPAQADCPNLWDALLTL